MICCIPCHPAPLNTCVRSLSLILDKCESEIEVQLEQSVFKRERLVKHEFQIFVWEMQKDFIECGSMLAVQTPCAAFPSTIRPICTTVYYPVYLYYPHYPVYPYYPISSLKTSPSQPPAFFLRTVKDLQITLAAFSPHPSHLSLTSCTVLFYI